jgi:hypothetical protein
MKSTKGWFKAAFTVVVFLLFSSCIELTRTHEVEVQNRSTANVTLQFTSSFFSPTDSIVRLANGKNYLVFTSDMGNAPPHMLFEGRYYDTCHVIFNDTLRLTYFIGDSNVRNILVLDNYHRETIKDTKRSFVFRDTYTLTPEDFENAKPF